VTPRAEPDDAQERLPPLAEPDGLAGALPDLLTAPVQEQLEAAVPATTSIEIVAADVVVVPESIEIPEPPIPALPELEAVEPQPLPVRPEKGPEGFWPRLVYRSTLGLVKPRDSWRVQERNALDARIARPLEHATFIPVLTRKGGVGKTTVAVLLGMAMAAARDDRVIAIDANPDRGTLAERVGRRQRATVRDVVAHAPSITGKDGLAEYVASDPATGLDVLASDTDPLLAEAFEEGDYLVVADIVARDYAVVVTDCGTGIVHSVMRAVLARADAIVVVSGGSVDEARLASETLTWLEANGYLELVRNAVVAINTATHATSVARLDDIRSHFASRVREVVIMPYDPQLAAGSVVDFIGLRAETRIAARELAAAVIDGIGSDGAAA
jgi:MinD-like ATPase involved in chromosome partitioning or flagellar assembly